MDLYFAIDDHRGDDAGTRWRVLAEVLPEDNIEGGEVARIVQPDTAAHDVFGTVVGLCEDCKEVANGLVRLPTMLPSMTAPSSMGT